MDAAQRNEAGMDADERNQAGLFLHWLVVECGYREVRLISATRWAGIAPKMFTHAIVTGTLHDRISCDDGWCYHGYWSARTALDAWAAVHYADEPSGWHRHPASGRRISEDADERDDTGRLVGAIGVLYRRP